MLFDIIQHLKKSLQITETIVCKAEKIWKWEDVLNLLFWSGHLN